MIQVKKEKCLLGWVLAVAMVPLFMGLVCPCVDAQPIDQPVIERARCHDCCPQMKLGRGSCETGNLGKSVLIMPSKIESSLSAKQENLLQFSLVIDSGFDFALPRERDLSSPGERFGEEPLYLLNRVLRI